MNAHHEPSATGVARPIRATAVYIGCRTTAYGPVATTRCPGCTSIDARGRSVLPQHADEQTVGDEHDDVRGNDGWQGHAGPAKPPIESRDQQERQEDHARERNDAALSQVLLARAHPALQQLGIARKENRRRQHHRDQDDRQIRPRLPVCEGPGGQDEQGRENHDTPDQSQERHPGELRRETETLEFTRAAGALCHTEGSSSLPFGFDVRRSLSCHRGCRS